MENLIEKNEKVLAGELYYFTFNDGCEVQSLVLFDENLELYTLYQKNQKSLESITIDRANFTINKKFKIGDKSYNEITKIKDNHSSFDYISSELVIIFSSSNKYSIVKNNDNSIILITNKRFNRFYNTPIEYYWLIISFIIIVGLYANIVIHGCKDGHIIKNKDKEAIVKEVVKNEKTDLAISDKTELDKLNTSLELQTESLLGIESDLESIGKENNTSTVPLLNNIYNSEDEEFRNKIESALK